MGRPVVHFEIGCGNSETTGDFYSKLFDWKLEDVPNPAAPDGNYTMVNVGDGTGGGIMKQVQGGPSGWLAYVEVDDIQAATQKARSLGGKVMKEPFEVIGRGWIGFIQDPDGAILGFDRHDEVARLAVHDIPGVFFIARHIDELAVGRDRHAVAAIGQSFHP